LNTDLNLPSNEVADYSELLSAEEKVRAAKFSFPNKYEEFVITRGLLRDSLGTYLNKDPKQIEIKLTEYDKPFTTEMIDGKNISFNVSHSHGKAIIAIGLDRNIGIDIEKIRSDVEFEKLSKRYFSDTENKALMQCEHVIRAETFYTIWTRKEALVKAIGKGIAFGLKEFEVSASKDKPPFLLNTHWDNAQLEKWTIINVEAPDGYITSLASDGNKFLLYY